VSPLCTAHHSRARVHGDPRQTLITRQELKPFEDRVRKVMATRNQALIVSTLTEINDRIRRYAEAEIAQFHRGTASNRHLITACDQLQKVSTNVDPVRIAVTLAALFLLRDYQPRRFVSDEGMVGAIVRQYRLPSGIARGMTYDRKRNKDIGWFKSLPKEVTRYMGKVIVEMYGPWIAHLVQAEKRLLDDEQRIARDMALAFAPKEAAE
jgi:hypothetical protein